MYFTLSCFGSNFNQRGTDNVFNSSSRPLISSSDTTSSITGLASDCLESILNFGQSYQRTDTVRDVSGNVDEERSTMKRGTVNSVGG